MDEKTKKIAFFVFYGFLFLYLIFAINGNRKNDPLVDNSSKKEENKTIVKNYGFTHIINDSIELNGKVYGLKVLTTKKENNVETVYYEDGKNIYIKEGDVFVKYEGKVVDNIDTKLLDILYVHELLGDEKTNEIKEKTDYTIELSNSKVNMNVVMYYDENQEWYKMIISKDDYKIESRYYDADVIEDFNVTIK